MGESLSAQVRRLEPDHQPLGWNGDTGLGLGRGQGEAGLRGRTGCRKGVWLGASPRAEIDKRLVRWDKPLRCCFFETRSLAI